MVAWKGFGEFKPGVNNSLDVPLKPPPKVPEHCRSSRQNNVVVQRPPNINWAVLDHSVDNFGNRSREIRIWELKQSKYCQVGPLKYAPLHSWPCFTYIHTLRLGVQRVTSFVSEYWLENYLYILFLLYSILHHLHKKLSSYKYKFYYSSV